MRAAAAAEQAALRTRAQTAEDERGVLQRRLDETAATLMALVDKHTALEQDARAAKERAAGLACEKAAAIERADARERERDAVAAERDKARAAARRGREALEASGSQLEASARKARDAMTGLPNAVGSIGETAGGGHMKILSGPERALLKDEAAARRRLISLYARAVAGLAGGASGSDGLVPSGALEAAAALSAATVALEGGAASH